jgi:hypothetical protein
LYILITGKLVVSSEQLRARLLLILFLIPVLSSCLPDLDPVDPDVTFSHAVELVEAIGFRPTGSDGSLEAGEYIWDTFADFGLEDPHFQDFTVGSVVGRNVVAGLTGTTYPSSILLVGAHYDSIPGGVGSMDNATGVATLLEIARYYGQNPPAYSFRFVAFDAEEIGLLGSGVYYEDSMVRGELNDTLLMLNLDITDTNAFPPESPLITFVVPRHPAAREAFHRAKEVTLPASSLTFPFDTDIVQEIFEGGFFGDIHHWRDEPLLAVWPQTYGEEYHTRPGSISEIDRIGLAVTTRIILEFLRALQGFPPEDLQVAGATAVGLEE